MALHTLGRPRIHLDRCAQTLHVVQGHRMAGTGLVEVALDEAGQWVLGGEACSLVSGAHEVAVWSGIQEVAAGSRYRSGGRLVSGVREVATW